MCKEPIANFLKGAIALCTLLSKGANVLEKQSKKIRNGKRNNLFITPNFSAIFIVFSNST